MGFEIQIFLILINGYSDFELRIRQMLIIYRVFITDGNFDLEILSNA